MPFIIWVFVKDCIKIFTKFEKFTQQELSCVRESGSDDIFPRLPRELSKILFWILFTCSYFAALSEIITSE